MREGERLVLLAGVFVIVGGIGALSAIGYAAWCAVAFVAVQW